MLRVVRVRDGLVRVRDGLLCAYVTVLCASITGRTGTPMFPQMWCIQDLRAERFNLNEEIQMGPNFNKLLCNGSVFGDSPHSEVIAMTCCKR